MADREQLSFFESVIIKYMFEREEFRDRVLPYISAKLFDEEGNKSLVSFLIDYVEKYEEFPKMPEIKVAVDDSDIYDRAVEILETDISEYNEKFLYDQVEDFIREKLTYNTIVDGVEYLKADEKDKIQDLPDKLREAVTFTFDDDLGESLFDNPEEFYDYLHNKDETFPTGLGPLDEWMDGGFHRKTLNLFMGEAGMGKTLTKVSLAAHFAMQNKNVLYITLELPAKKIRQRILANILSVKMNDIKFITKTDFIKSVDELRQKISTNLMVKEYPTSSVNTNHIRTYLKELKTKMKFVPDFIFVDYLGILLPCRSSKTDNSNTTWRRVAEDLRGLGGELNIPIVSSVQTNRDGYGSAEVDMKNIAESIGIVQTTDLLIAITQTEELKKIGRYIWSILKNRFNFVGNDRATIGVDYHKMTVYNCEEDGNTNNTSVLHNPNTHDTVIDKASNDVADIFSNNKRLQTRDIIGLD